MPKKANASTKDNQPDGFINVAVDVKTRAGLHELKQTMGVGSQAEVIAKLVAMGLALQRITHN